MGHSPHFHEHLRKKAVRKANLQEVLTDEKQPTKEQLKKQIASEKKLKWKEGKLRSKSRSKRTSTREVDFETEPESIHPEGERWMKTIQKQSNERSKLLEHRLKKKKK